MLRLLGSTCAYLIPNDITRTPHAARRLRKNQSPPEDKPAGNDGTNSWGEQELSNVCCTPAGLFCPRLGISLLYITCNVCEFLCMHQGVVCLFYFIFYCLHAAVAICCIHSAVECDCVWMCMSWRTDLFSALVRLPVHSSTSRGHSHGHSHSFCSILNKTKQRKRGVYLTEQHRFDKLQLWQTWIPSNQRGTACHLKHCNENQHHQPHKDALIHYLTGVWL